MDLHDNDSTLEQHRMAHAWEEMRVLDSAGISLPPKASRIAFDDPEFLLRSETRHIRLQLEMLKPELELQQQEIDHTIVVYGSARVRSSETVEHTIQTAAEQGHPLAAAEQARMRRGATQYEAARRFAHLVATHSQGRPRHAHLYVCTGGGPGIMEAANRGAFEAGEPTLGFNITLPHEQHPNPYITPALNFTFHYFAMRKMHFMIRAKALVVFPGGFGTLDELFEVITLVQTHKIRNRVPIVMYGSAYWKRLLDLDLLVEEGMIAPGDLDMLSYVDSPEDAWQAIRDFYQPACGGGHAPSGLCDLFR
ncbi:TIGR00730 family Rossman fold protein [Brachymonas sp.]|uniref:LOG family protein n=1 Tax=Brachymonas sp. TaxID=1936292 RepID=UPI0035B349F6